MNTGVCKTRILASRCSFRVGELRLSIAGNPRRFFMKGLASKFLCSFLMTVALSCAAFSQNITGTISGTVADSKGGAVANATITITNSEQNIVVRTLTTDQQGQYSAPLLPVGRYSVTAQASAFKNAVHSGL